MYEELRGKRGSRLAYTKALYVRKKGKLFKERAL